jgi:transposase, IS5 family
MPKRSAMANAAKSKVQAHVEYVFAWQKNKMGRFIRTIWIKRAKANVMLDTFARNMHRLIFLERRITTG